MRYFLGENKLIGIEDGKLYEFNEIFKLCHPDCIDDQKNISPSSDKIKPKFNFKKFERVKKTKSQVVKDKKERNKESEKKCKICGEDAKISGLCIKHYHSEYRKKLKDNINKDKNKVYRYECLDCYKQFKSPLPYELAKCPVDKDHSLVQKGSEIIESQSL